MDPGENNNVSSNLTRENLAMYDIDMNWGSIPAILRFFAGRNSEDLLESDSVWNKQRADFSMNYYGVSAAVESEFCISEVRSSETQSVRVFRC